METRIKYKLGNKDVIKLTNKQIDKIISGVALKRPSKIIPKLYTFIENLLKKNIEMRDEKFFDLFLGNNDIKDNSNEEEEDEKVNTYMSIFELQKEKFKKDAVSYTTVCCIAKKIIKGYPEYNPHFKGDKQFLP